MKILQIFGAVIAVHVLAFFFIFAVPGCQSSPRNIPTPDATAPMGGGNMAGTVVTYTPAETGSIYSHTPPTPAGRAEPTRPGSPNAAAIAPAKPLADDVAPVSTYTVVRGDSLWSIAKANSLTVSELAKANQLSSGSTLQSGKKLMIPGKVGLPQDLSTSAATAARVTESKPAPAARNADAMRHTIQSGESLGAIARKYQVTVGELAAANNITDPAKIRAGQQLIIPGLKSTGSTRAASTTPTTAAATAPATTEAAANQVPRFEIAPPPPGQDLDAALNEAATDVPTIKVEEVRTPPKG
ncbi:MAG: LysM peptidoglycan-binding domain-containing protein [Candidatus Didemnitutus sp.]|nr:LysM peptidoglycan-binding domain-containing protein [Candidatus Didemnitutus sp.]